MHPREIFFALGGLGIVLLISVRKKRAGSPSELRAVRGNEGPDGDREGPVPTVDDRHFEHGDAVEEASWESFPASDSPAW